MVSRDPVSSFSFAGHAVTGGVLCKEITRAADREARVSGMPWSMLRLLSSVVPSYRELGELAYLWSVPHRTDGGRVEAAIGALPHTLFNRVSRPPCVGPDCRCHDRPARRHRFEIREVLACGCRR